MFGFSALFGRSREVRRLDDALRAAGLHPALMPDAVKIAALKLLKEDGYGASPDLSACTIAAEMLTYCILGDLGFGEEQGRGAARALEARLEAALAAGDSLDARLILLALHAGIIQGALVDRYGASSTVSVLGFSLAAAIVVLGLLRPELRRHRGER